MVLPCDLAPLKYQGPSNADIPHEQALCSVCLLLGRNCSRNAPPEEVITSDKNDDGIVADIKDAHPSEETTTLKGMRRVV